MAARNHSIMLTTNIDITDSLINGQVGVVKYFKFLGDKVEITYIKFDDINAGKKLIQTDNLYRRCTIKMGTYFKN